VPGSDGSVAFGHESTLLDRAPTAPERGVTLSRAHLGSAPGIFVGNAWSGGRVSWSVLHFDPSPRLGSPCSAPNRWQATARARRGMVIVAPDVAQNEVRVVRPDTFDLLGSPGRIRTSDQPVNSRLLRGLTVERRDPSRNPERLIYQHLS
jgi:hypothetical protein